MYKVVDLFAGCGGLSKGFEEAGYNIVGAFEFWDVATICYAQNFSHPIFQEDLSDTNSAIKKIAALAPDIIIGGPPCQDFSHAGKRIESTRAGLTESYANIIAAIHPQWFVMENVDRAQKSNSYASARDIFVAAGYGLTEMVLDASLCGVPQKRKRFFCIGSLGQKDGFLSKHIESHMSKNSMTLRNYFGDRIDYEFYYRHPRNYSRRAVFSIDEPAPTIRGVNRPVPKGYPGHPNDACKLNDSVRALTTQERAQIQTFPSDFQWNGNKTDMEQMIGNAVPVKLAEFVAKALSYHISQCVDHSTVNYNDFLEWLQHTHGFSKRTEKDTLSRLKRANAICELPPNPDAYYVFQLTQADEYKTLTTTVRSQLKRAVSLYADYCKMA